MKATVTEVQTLNLQLNKDEAITLARIVKRHQNDGAVLGTFQQKFCADLVENIKTGMQVQV